MYLKGICKVSRSTNSRHHMQLYKSASAESETTEPSQNQKRWMTSNDIKLNISINSHKKNIYSCGLLHDNIILLGGLFLLLHLGFSMCLFLPPSTLSLLIRQLTFINIWWKTSNKHFPRKTLNSFSILMSWIASRWIQDSNLITMTIVQQTIIYWEEGRTALKRKDNNIH